MLNNHTHTRIIKATRDQELARIRQLIGKLEGSIARRFKLFITDMRSADTLRDVRRLLEAGDIEGALSIVDAHVVDLSDSISSAFEQAGVAEAAALTRGARVGITFDPGDPAAAQLMQQSKLEFIKGFTADQKAATRQAVTRALKLGKGTDATARAFRDSVGLTAYQEGVVNNYRTSLETGSSDALDRALRDKRFDRTVGRSIREDKPLTAEQIDRMTERYQQNMIARRALTIARTETQRAVNTARHAAMAQAADQADVSTDDIVRTWNATLDDRTRDTHADMDGQEVDGLDTPFESESGALLMYPGDPDAPPEETINCRCVVTYDLPSGDEVEQESDE